MRTALKPRSADSEFGAVTPDWGRDIYQAWRQLNLYPFEVVVSFVFANAPAKPRTETRILEVGCGAGNNLWFAAREGFAVVGLDLSAAAPAARV